MEPQEHKAFVGGLAWRIESDDLGQMFEEFDVVTSAFVVKDRETRRSRGFGFVCFQTAEGLERAIAGMEGKEVEGRILKVNAAQEKR